MNIMFIAYSEMIPYHGGIQRVTSIIANELKQREHNVYYLCATSKQNTDNVAEYPISLYLDKPFEIAFDEGTKKLYLSYLEKYEIDVVVLQYPLLNKSSFFLKNTPQYIPLISCLHIQPFFYRKIRNSSDFIKFPFYYLRELFYIRNTYHFSTRLCLLSERFIPRIQSRAFLVKKDKLCSINNPNTFNEVSDDLSKKEDAILFVGRLTRNQKNIEDFISMWSILQKQKPAWKAYIVGDGPERQNLERFANSLSCKNLFFEGNRKNVAEYYEKSKFICLTSSYEGWGMVLTEGMAYGCIPVAYGTYESVYDIIDDGECGFVTKAYSPQDMAEAILTLIDNPKRMNDFLKKAKEKIKCFSSDVIADKWEELFNEVVKK